jgi:hypothetical protein
MCVNQDFDLELYKSRSHAARALSEIKRRSWIAGTPKIVPATITLYE